MSPYVRPSGLNLQETEEQERLRVQQVEGHRAARRERLGLTEEATNEECDEVEKKLAAAA